MATSKKKNSSKKQVSKKAEATPSAATKSHPKLMSVWALTRTTAQTLWRQRLLFGGITLVYGLLTAVLAQTLIGSTDIPGLKDELSTVFSQQWGGLVSSLGVFAVLLSAPDGTLDQTAAAYRLFAALIASLAVIWALRQTAAGHAVRVKDSFYLGMYPLVPFILVLVVIGIQLLPLLIGSSLYSFVVSNGIAVYAAEKLFWGVLYVVLAAWSLYMLSASLLALYIVTLPNMTPRKALRSAKQLVAKRRWAVLRKLVWLPFVLVIAAVLIMLPAILWLTVVAQWIFFALTMFGLVFGHAYMYTLYRELLNE